MQLSLLLKNDPSLLQPRTEGEFLAKPEEIELPPVSEALVTWHIDSHGFWELP